MIVLMKFCISYTNTAINDAPRRESKKSEGKEKIATSIGGGVYCLVPPSFSTANGVNL